MAGMINFSQRAAQYAAAKTSRSTGSWLTPTGSVNDIIKNSLPTVRNRVRQLVRDFPYLARSVNAAVDYFIGSGYKLQSRVKKSNGNLDEKRINAIEMAWENFVEKADYSGRLHLSDMSRLAKRQDLECGEFILIRHYSGDYIPLSYQIVEPDWLSDSQATMFNAKNTLNQGVEYDPITGRIVGYHFSDPYSFKTSFRVQAESVLHKFEVLRPGQTRGISQLTPAVLMADSLKTLMESELDASKMASKWAAFVTTNDPGAFQTGSTLDSDGNRIQEIENGTIEYLKPGESISMSAANRPSQNFMPYVKLLLRKFSICSGLPYEIISGDYDGLNYTVLRGKRNDFAQEAKPVIARHIRHFYEPIFKDFLRVAVASGVLSLPGYPTDPKRYESAYWQEPGMPPIDPLKEAKADADNMANLLKSPFEIVSARGRDLEEVYEEIRIAKELQKEKGIEPEEISTALGNSPSAIEDQDNDNE